MWDKGQKVLCVDDRFSGGVWDWGDQLPRRGRVYTIQSAHWSQNHDTGIWEFSYLVEELKNPEDQLSFAARHFQALETTQATQQDKKADTPSVTVQQQLQLELLIS